MQKAPFFTDTNEQTFEAELADAWAASENGLQWNMDLEADMRRHDGTNLPTEDVLLTCEQLLDTEEKVGVD
jgi:MarR-like DNA-binding transcriptional regulator SgrR of sgrS sRNA